MASDSAAAPRPGGQAPQLPPDLAAINEAEADDRPVPALGLGDEQAAEAMVQATRLLLTATTPEAVVAAVATFAVQLGGELIPAALDTGSALPVDITLGTSTPVLVDADALSVARMRLEQHLPTILEDARLTVTRLRHLADLHGASVRDPATGLLTHTELLRQGATLGLGDVVSIVEIEELDDVDADRRPDEVVRSCGRAIAEVIWPSDSIGRLASGAIVVLQRAVPERDAAARLRQLQARRDDPSSGCVPFSAGVAAVGAEGWTGALASAESALRDAKVLGPNHTSTRAERTP